mgnify:FL=1
MIMTEGGGDKSKVTGNRKDSLTNFSRKDKDTSRPSGGADRFVDEKKHQSKMRSMGKPDSYTGRVNSNQDNNHESQTSMTDEIPTAATDLSDDGATLLAYSGLITLLEEALLSHHD